MPAPQKPPARRAASADTTEAVNALLAASVHPRKPEIEAIRIAILKADPAIREGVKWNAPSFRTHEYFATMNFREKEGIGVILHLGAKVRELGPLRLKIPDPSSLLRWLANDRAALKFTDLEDFDDKQGAFIELVRVWIRHV